jgi:hypothetical protein
MLGNLTLDRLRGIEDGRRHIVSALAIARDAKMLDDALHRLVTSDAKTGLLFFRNGWPSWQDLVALFTEALRIAETRAEPAGKQFYRGLIAGTDQRDPCQARIFMIGSGKLQPEGLQLIVSLLQSNDVVPWQCAKLSYGRGLDHLSPWQIMPLPDELGQHGARGHWVVLDII